MADISSIVLAGGRSLRLGRDKMRENLESQSLLERVLGHLEGLGGEIVVVMSEESSFPLPGRPALRKVSDIYPGRGALGGLYTGLCTSATLYNIVVAGDMPFLNLELLRYLAGVSAGFDAVIPRLSGMMEPLHAVYSRNCLPAIEALLPRGEVPICDFYPLVSVRYVEEAEMAPFDPQHLSFFNINTAADLERARRLLQKQGNPF